MEGLYLSSTDVSNINKYYNIANNKVKKDITTLFSKSESLTQKEMKRLKKYSFRYKMILQHIADNTDARLNKLTRKPLTIPNKDID